MTLASYLGAAAGGALLLGSPIVGIVVFTAGGASWVAAAVLAVVQVTAAVLLLVGSSRLATGAGRGVLLAGIALTFLTCATRALNAGILETGDPTRRG